LIFPKSSKINAGQDSGKAKQGRKDRRSGGVGSPKSFSFKGERLNLVEAVMRAIAAHILEIPAPSPGVSAFALDFDPWS
jgi:hypothetical protein